MNIINTLVNGLLTTDEEKKNIEIYQYGMRISCELLINLLCSIGLAIILGKIREVIFFFVIFIPLRMLSGGPHLKKYVTCLVASIGVLFFLIYLSQLIMFSNQVQILSFLLGALGIIKCSPLDERGRLSSKMKRFLNINIRIYMLLLGGLLSLLLVRHFNAFAQLLVLITDMMCILLFIGKIKSNAKHKCLLKRNGIHTLD